MLRQQEWEKNRSFNPLQRQESAHKWEEVKYKGRRAYHNKQGGFTKPHQPQSIKLEKRYEVLDAGSEIELGETTDSRTTQYTQPDHTTHPGMYKFTHDGRMKQDMSEIVRG